MKKINLLILSIFLISFVIAGIPINTNVQLKIEEDFNKPVTYEIQINSSIYDSYTGGNLLYTQSNNVTPNEDGVTTITLQNIDLDFREQYYLGIKIGSENESQRINLTTNPYAYTSNYSFFSNNTYNFDGYSRNGFRDWLKNFFCELTGCNMTGNLNVTGNVSIENDLNVTGEMYGQPLNGGMDSGIIWAEEIDSYGNLNTTIVSGLQVKYPAFKVRLAKTDGSVKYCDITGDTVTVTNDQQSVYYIDFNCTVNNVKIQNYILADFSPGGQADFMDVVAHDGLANKPVGTTIQNKINIKSRKQSLYLNNLKVSEGFDITTQNFPHYTISEGIYNYIDDIVTTSFVNTSTDNIEFMYHSGGEWTESLETGLNYSYCDDGVNLVTCANPNQYRRYFIFMFGYTDGKDSTEVHQLASINSMYYPNIEECLDTTENPLTYTLPEFYEFSLVPLFAYCGRPNDATWNGKFIDLRTVRTGSAQTEIDTSVFLLRDGTRNLTGNWDAGDFNITASWFKSDSLNITGVTDGGFSCYIYNSNGGCMLGGNETCNILYSPDGLTRQEVCN